jgi:hypothetical protein
VIPRPGLWLVMLAAAEAVIAILVYGDVHSPVRVVAVLSFLLICPGMAWIRLLKLDERLTEVVLAIALSVAIDAALPGAMVYAGRWSAGGALAAVLALTLAGATVETIRATRRPGSAAA